ncbi:hypothetical protein SKAU_G00112840 [Synaphobranchus kaupii]|uniref:Uncharacterized protein n=1 Tax=Synaphobranchus kaupii TaxID=118154 RepID=A0A9Q1G1Y0_SYNKA|nr:hypothetical protein SKAU_G00112840 [Synaphobranchus kaupii]
MPMVVASHGRVPPDTTQPPLEIRRGYPWWVGLKRERRSDSEPGHGAVCNADDLERDPNKCCERCPPGYHYNKTSECEGGSGAGGRCSRCGKRTYIHQMNRREKCERCTDCDVGGSVIQVEPCAPEKNTQCGCEEGYYTSDPDPHNYICKKCSECANRNVATACAEKSDTKCGSCISDFYEDPQKTCQRCKPNDFERSECPNQTTTLQTPSITKTPNQGSLSEESLVLTFSISVVAILILGLLCCFLNHCTCRELLSRTEAPKQPYQFHPVRDVPQGEENATSCNGYCENHQHLLTAVPKRNVSQDTTTELQVNTGVYSPATSLRKEADPRALREDPHTSDSWPAAALYTVIREVPARRWKEFLRLLSVTDVQMERVEMEVGPCYLEQQYQMLRLWSLKGGAALEAVYSALHSMDLSGCAQELQEKLQQLQQQVA